MEEPTPIIQFGKYSIPDPCPVAEEDLRHVGHGKQYCGRCQLVVHDISGMEPRAIDALWEKNGGKLCAAFHPAKPPLTRNAPRPISMRIAPLWLKSAAAAATFAALLLRTPDAHAVPWKPLVAYQQQLALGSPDRVVQAPMLLSTVILDTNEENLMDDLVIQVQLPSGEVREITTARGFFALNLEGLVAADDVIKISADAQEFEDLVGSRTYVAFSHKVKASEAQNLNLKIETRYLYNRMSRGGVRR